MRPSQGVRRYAVTVCCVEHVTHALAREKYDVMMWHVIIGGSS